MSDDCDYSRLREGICPYCNVALVRYADYGKCPKCTIRFSLVGDTINVHIVYPDTQEAQRG